MCSAVLDDSRRSWTREDWSTYNEKDAQFSKNFKDAMLKGDVAKVNSLIEEGKYYYHFSDIASIQILFAENMDLYLAVMNQRHLFYKYDSIR